MTSIIEIDEKTSVREEDGHIVVRMKTRKRVISVWKFGLSTRVWRFNKQVVVYGESHLGLTLLVIGGPYGGHVYQDYYGDRAEKCFERVPQGGKVLWPQPLIEVNGPTSVSNPKIAAKIRPFSG